jgi:methylglyoxal synthase
LPTSKRSARERLEVVRPGNANEGGSDQLRALIMVGRLNASCFFWRGLKGTMHTNQALAGHHEVAIWLAWE